MILLKVVGFEKFGVHRLVDDKNNEYRLVLQFFGDVKPEIGDQLFLDERYLDRKWENFAQPYAFSSIEGEVFKKDKNFSETDYITIHIAKTGRDVLLKRLYG